MRLAAARFSARTVRVPAPDVAALAHELHDTVRTLDAPWMTVDARRRATDHARGLLAALERAL
jgi:hypothetical protein